MKKVCVVEDNQAVNKLFTTIIKKIGYEVVSFTNGQDCIDWAKENSVDLVLMDMLLPDYTGIEIIQQILPYKGYTEIPIVAVTGFATEYSMESLREYGFTNYMTKPVNTKVFMETIKNLVN